MWPRWPPAIMRGTKLDAVDHAPEVHAEHPPVAMRGFSSPPQGATPAFCTSTSRRRGVHLDRREPAPGPGRAVGAHRDRRGPCPLARGPTAPRRLVRSATTTRASSRASATPAPGRCRCPPPVTTRPFSLKCPQRSNSPRPGLSPSIQPLAIAHPAGGKPCRAARRRSLAAPEREDSSQGGRKRCGGSW